MKKLSLKKILFIGGWCVLILGIISNIDTTLELNANQYVSEGEKPEPLEVMDFIGDITYPIFNALVLFALSNIVKNDD